MKNVLELFGGCGGLGYGFHKLGFNIVACNEYDSQIAETYKHNYPDTNVIVGDITDKSIKEDIYGVFKSTSCDVVLGGPPCVAYSMSGKRNSRDPRGQLFKDYVEIVGKLKPKVFIMENVKGILTMMHDKAKMTPEEKIIANEYYELEKEKELLNDEKKNISFTNEIGTEKSEINNQKLKEVNKKLTKMKKQISKFRMKLTDIIQNNFNEIGYNVKMKLLNSANYGVPQKRQRVIFIGTRRDLGLNVAFPTETHNENGTEGKLKWVTVKEAISDLKEIPEDKSIQQIYTKHSDEFIKKIENTPQGKSVNPKYTEAFFRCNEDKPSNTVKENHGGVFIHYEKNRVMTPRELARLQSFPDDFIFKGSKTSILVQLGNAVPCGLSQAIAEEVMHIYN
jgi:DNA (cytosine-5)-methyltransferase 1